MATPNLSLIGVLSETERIINAHSRHFLALSVLFLLPLSFSVVVYPYLSPSHSLVSLYHKSSLFYSTSNGDTGFAEIPNLLIPLYALFLLLISLCGIASVTHSTFNGFYGRPVKLIPSIKSIVFSFFPLITTLFCAIIVVGLIICSFWGFTILAFNMGSLFGFEIELSSSYTMAFYIVVLALLAALLIYMKVEWYLCTVIVIVESKWGFSPLKRSSYLIKGMKRVAISLILLFGSLGTAFSLVLGVLIPTEDEFDLSCVRVGFIIETMIFTGLLTVILLYKIAAITVLLMYCKALRGELACEIAEEFSREYLSLPFDDDKVPHVVYVV